MTEVIDRPETETTTRQVETIIPEPELAKGVYYWKLPEGTERWTAPLQYANVARDVGRVEKPQGVVAHGEAKVATKKTGIWFPVQEAELQEDEKTVKVDKNSPNYWVSLDPKTKHFRGALRQEAI